MDHELTEATTSIVVDIMPNCTALKNNHLETKVIVITFLGGGEFWLENSALRTIWVRICLHQHKVSMLLSCQQIYDLQEQFAPTQT